MSRSRDRISVEQRPRGHLEGRQVRSSLGLYTKASSRRASAEKLQHWLSQSSIQSVAHSSNPPNNGYHHDQHSSNPPNNGYHHDQHSSNPPNNGYHHDHHRRLGRPTKASLLRMKSCPVTYAQSDFQEMARIKKHFAQRCKSLSTAMIMCSKLPQGETVHGFLTGARYNSAHHVDSRSLERLGLYIPRKDTCNSFVNPAGTIPPSPAIYGSKHYPRGYHTHTLLYQSATQGMIQSDTGFYGYTPYPRECTADIDRELDQVFGPDEGGSSSSSAIAVCEAGSSASLGVQDESIAEVSSSPTNGGEEKEEVSDETDSSNTLTEDEREGKVTAGNMPQGEETSGSQDKLLDYISPIAQKLTDDILKECRASTSSLSNQNRLHDSTFKTNAVIHDSTVQPGDNHTARLKPPSTRPQNSAKARSQDSAKVRSHSAQDSAKTRPQSAHESTSNINPRCSASQTGRPKSAQDSRHISPRSSSTHIFIDLTSLHPPTDDDSASTHSY